MSESAWKFVWNDDGTVWVRFDRDHPAYARYAEAITEPPPDWVIDPAKKQARIDRSQPA